MSAALLVFAKVPQPGRVKTRLCPPLAPEQAAALYEAFLLDALDRYAAWAAAPGGPAVRLYLGGGGEEKGRGGDEEGRKRGDEGSRPHPLLLSPSPGSDRTGPPALVPAAVSVHRQRGDGLGERMLRAFVETFAAGHDRAVVVGTDHPTLPTAFLGLAFDALSDPLTAVLGPSDDGGYYLLGLNEVVPDLFDMDYSHDEVFSDTLDRAMQADLTPVVLPAHYDVDDGPALARLVGEWRSGADVGPRAAVLLRTLTEGGALAG